MTLIWIFAGLAALLFGARLIGRRNARRAEADAPAIGSMTRVSGGAIHWTSDGPTDADAPVQTVVCIHGLSGNLRNFTYALTPLLRDRFRVIAIDRPGCGYSRRGGFADASFEAQARMIAAFLDAEGVERPILAGHSLGGALALQLALDYPDKVGGIALLAPLTRPAAPPMFALIDIPFGGARAALGATVAGALGPLQANSVLGRVFAPEPVPASFRIEGGADLALRADNFVASAEDLTASRPSLRDLAARTPDLKTLGGVLFGTADEVLEEPLHGAAFAKTAPHLSYEKIPGAGHMLPITQAQASAAFIRRIADRVRADAAPASP
ncbi:MAG: alpha/beta hydrolase [Pseudomonadota bacterium]